MTRTMLLVAIALAGLAPRAWAQRWERPLRRFIDRYYGVEVGITGGMDFNTVTGAPGTVAGRYRPTGGVYASFPLASALRFRIENLVTGKQYRVTQSVIPPCLPPGQCDPVFESSVQSLTWVELPLLADLRFHRALGSITPRVFGGPFVALRVACSTIVDAGAVPSAEAQVVIPCGNATPDVRYRNGDAGFVLGTGLTTGGVGLSFRWTRSLVTVAEPSPGTGGVNGVKQSTLSLMVELGTRLRR